MELASVVETSGQSLSTLIMPIIAYFERLIYKSAYWIILCLQFRE